MPPDPLSALARLRRFQVTTARRHLADRHAAAELAVRRQEEAAAALRVEGAQGDAAAYAAWLPRGLAEHDRARLAAHQAESRVAEAQDALGAARAAERLVETLREARAEEARRAALRRGQALLDEAATRRPLHARGA
jgi:flagellar export protein FliJ